MQEEITEEEGEEEEVQAADLDVIAAVFPRRTREVRACVRCACDCVMLGFHGRT